MSERDAGPVADEPDTEVTRAETALAGDVMPPWIPRAIGVLMLGLAALYIGNGLIVRLRSLIVILVVSLFFSFAIEPAVNWLAGRGVRRGVATFGMLLGLFVGTIVLLVAMGSVVVGEVADFVERAPDYIQRIEDWANDSFDADIEADELVDEISGADTDLQQLATELAANALSFTVAAVGFLFQFFTVALFTFYLVADGPRFRRVICSFLRPDRQRAVLRGWEIAIEKTGGYIYSRLLLAGLSAFSTFVFLSIVGVPYALALALWTGLVSQFVPTIGTYIGGALPVLVALLEDPVDGALVLAFILVYQQIENYFFSPRITARTMELHPAVAFGTVIAGASLAGGVGAVLALPAAAVIQAIGSVYVERHEVIESEMTRSPLRAGRRTMMDRLRGVRTDDEGDPADPTPPGAEGDGDPAPPPDRG